MRSTFVFCCSVVCSLALCLPASAQAAAQASGQPAAQPAQPQAASPIPDLAAYLAQQFGSSFKLDPKIKPLFGDLDGDGDQDVVLFATSPTPLLSQEQYRFRVEDPYDAYFGEGNPRITAQFTLHFDGSWRDILIVFGWRQPPTKRRSKHVSKFVLINTPLETVSLASLRYKKRNLQAIETVDRTGVHSLLMWNGKHWRWSAQGGGNGDLSFPKGY
jgi:hypothetical protein